MEEAVDPKPTRRRFRRIAWICWCVLAAMLLLVFFNVGLVVVEINRNVPTPKYESPFKFTTAMILDAPASSTLARAKITFFDRDTSKTIDLDGPCLEARLSVNETTAKNIRTINEAYARTLEAYAAYVKNEPGLTYIQSQERLNKIVGDWGNGSKAFWSDPLLPQLRNERFYAIGNFYDQLSLENAVKHEQWYRAGMLCNYYRRGWAEQVYYFQKAGKPGKYMIASLTSQRYWHALRGSVMSIGPDFHLPQLEENRCSSPSVSEGRAGERVFDCDYESS